MSEAREPITGTLYVYDHDFAPVMRGQWKLRACSVCAHDVMNHWNIGVATASQIGGRPEDYLTALENLCRHCGDPLTAKGDYWTHAHGLYRCQQVVTYGHNAAHPDVPCAAGGPNPCKCTHAPDGE